MAEASLVQHAPKTVAEKRLFEQLRKNTDLQGPEEPLKVDKENDSRISSSISNSTKGQAESKSSGRCFYTHLPHLIKKAGMSASELTAMNIDKVSTLCKLVCLLYAYAFSPFCVLLFAFM